MIMTDPTPNTRRAVLRSQADTGDGTSNTTEASPLSVAQTSLIAARRAVTAFGFGVGALNVVFSPRRTQQLISTPP